MYCEKDSKDVKDEKTQRRGVLKDRFLEVDRQVKDRKRIRAKK